MKIEIDLNDILGDEYGTETLQDSIRRQVIANLTKKVEEGIRRQIDEAVNLAINESVKMGIAEQMPTIMTDLIDRPYRPIDRYGSREKQETTFRSELIKTIQEQMKYEKKSYRSDENAFTRTVNEVIEENLKVFKKDFDAKILEIYSKEAFTYATQQMAAKLGIKL